MYILDTSVIVQPSVLTDSMGYSNDHCYGGEDGTAIVYLSGGIYTGDSPPSQSSYTYNWSNGQHTQTDVSLSVGTYKITATNSRGCSVVDSTTISQPTAIVDSVVSRTILCYGGSVDSLWVYASGGTPLYTYTWTGGTIGSDGLATDTITNIGIGTYNIHIKDANNCILNSYVSMTQPNLLTAFFDAGAGAIKSVLCNGGNTGSATISAIGGTTPYSYEWSDLAIGQKDSNLVAGNYFITVTDAHGCTAVDSVTITQPSALTLSLSTKAMYGIYYLQCNGGNTTINTAVGGGVTPDNYIWNNSSTGDNLANVVAGTYSSTVTDGNGCSTIGTITLTQPSAIIDTISRPLNGYGFNVSCSYNGVCLGDGSINLSVSGGVAGYTYGWTNGITDQNPTGLCAGFFGVIITDSIGCTHTDTITLTAPPPLGAVGDSALVYNNYSNVSCDTCKNGQIWALPTLGTAPYSYQWSNQNITTALFIADTLQTITNCGPWGVYYVAVGDVNGCRAVSSPIFLSNAVYSDWRTTGNYGDNAFLGTIDSTDLVVKTDGAERLRVTANGNVGIGTINPQERLHVSGNVRIDSLAFTDTTSNQREYKMLGVDALGNVFAVSVISDKFSFNCDFNDNGWQHYSCTEYTYDNVGIGTNNPMAKLDVVDNLSGNGEVAFSVEDEFDYSLFDVQSDGNVGIGTVNPISRFQVGNRETKINMADFWYPTTGITHYLGFNVGKNNQISNTWDIDDALGSIIMTDQGGGFQFGTFTDAIQWGNTIQKTDEQVANSVKMVINGNGNVGIGTINPQSKLEVDGNIYIIQEVQTGLVGHPQ